MKKSILSLLVLAAAAVSQQRPDIIGTIMGSQKAVIAVEILHASEVCAANSHDDDARGCTRSSDDSSDCLLHVSNLSISD